MTPLLFDIAIVVILLLFVLRGRSRGLILSLCGLAALLVAFVGASIIARVGSPMVANALEPKFAAAIEARLEESLAPDEVLPAGEELAPLSPDEVPLAGVLDILKDMGLYTDLIDAVHRAVNDGMLDAAASAAVAVAAAIAQSVAYLILFLLSFFLITIGWLLLSHALDLVAKLPGLHFLNQTGGAVFGLLQGAILLFVAAWLVQYLGNLIPEATVEQTYLLKFFLHTTPADLLREFL